MRKFQEILTLISTIRKKTGYEKKQELNIEQMTINHHESSSLSFFLQNLCTPI